MLLWIAVSSLKLVLHSVLVSIWGCVIQFTAIFRFVLHKVDPPRHFADWKNTACGACRTNIWSGGGGTGILRRKNEPLFAEKKTKLCPLDPKPVFAAYFNDKTYALDSSVLFPWRESCMALNIFDQFTYITWRNQKLHK